MAYSEKIRSKEYRLFIFKRVVKKMGMFLFGTGFPLAVLIWYKRSLLEISCIIGIIAFLLFHTMKLGEFFSPSWDGIVVEKRGCYTRKKQHDIICPRGCVTATLHPGLLCTLVVKRSKDNKLFRYPYLEFERDGLNDTVSYFRTGDKVRHHAFLPLVEKEDKSKDRWVLCLKCQKMAHKYNAVCHHCGMPVLK